jgi:organic radical activating enzyme
VGVVDAVTVPGLSVAAHVASQATVPVSECYGPVWQGEGPHAGRRCSFLRLGLCNLSCPWCDTPYTWDRSRFDVKAECPPRTAEWLIAQLSAHGTTMLVLTGGEPLIHSGSHVLHTALDAVPHEVHVETNGTLRPSAWLRDRVAHWTVSPKIAQDTDPWSRRIRPTVLAGFSEMPNAILKVVARSPQDVEALAPLLDEWGWWDADRVWIMPEGVTGDDVLATARWIEPAVHAAGYNLTLRQHTLMHGTERLR